MNAKLNFQENLLKNIFTCVNVSYLTKNKLFQFLV